MAEVTADISKTLNALKKLRGEFENRSGLINRTSREVAKALVKRAAQRFRQKFRRSGNGPDVRAAIIKAGFSVIQDPLGDITILMFDEDKLDNLTALPRTVVTGQVFHLWRLLSAGFGRLGSGDRSRGHTGGRTLHNYPLFVVIQTSAIIGEVKQGRNPPFPELVSLEGSGVKVIRHPGFKGREWFLQNSRLFLRDRTLVRSKLNKAIKEAIRRSGIKAI